MPREHGAWAMLLIPFVAGAAIGGLSLASGLSLAAMLLMFLARPSISGSLAARRRARSGARGPVPVAGAVMTAVALLFFIWLLAARALYGLAWLGAAAAVLTALHETLRARAPRSQAAELAGVALLTLSAPLAQYTGSGCLSAEAGWLWFLSAGYFAISVFQVRLKVSAAARHAGHLRQRAVQSRRTMAYLVCLWTALAVLAAAGQIPAVALPAFAPATAYAILGFRALGRRVNLRREGAAQSVLALAFCLLLIAGYRV